MSVCARLTKRQRCPRVTTLKIHRDDRPRFAQVSSQTKIHVKVWRSYSLKPADTGLLYLICTQRQGRIQSSSLTSRSIAARMPAEHRRVSRINATAPAIRNPLIHALTSVGSCCFGDAAWQRHYLPFVSAVILLSVRCDDYLSAYIASLSFTCCKVSFP